MRYLMSETVQFSSILTLTSTYHVALTMNDLLRYYFLGICVQILLIIDTNYMLIMC